eukprot:CAMPEP_0119328438 /NCGR_PEP_ID=MMETSP1333-20130426/73349_1 /TAXON_ID=418940 /ORGANISM="Scyphosphaera apsteinii, Strain RCC1455" /LENGTH=456 /DNA_ID=CAMNT_0007337291 /DNA_START=258 /DNA_END=1629 /DNA_ORIENTATION=+
MSMFLWRNISAYQKEDETGKRIGPWRINKKQHKPAKPVRVEGIRGETGKVSFSRAVLMPDGNLHPFKKEHTNFVDFWRQLVEQWERDAAYRAARAIPEVRHCPRCDGVLNWVRRVPVNFTYEEIHAKRRIYQKQTVVVSDCAHDRTDESIDGADSEKTDDGRSSARNLEDRYCCPNDMCFIHECRIEFRHNTAQVEVLKGIISESTWKPENRKHRERSLRAKARWAGVPFDRGVSPETKKMPWQEVSPYRKDNKVTHEEALEIVERKEIARSRKPLSWQWAADEPVFHAAPYIFISKADPSLITCLLCRGICDSDDGGTRTAYGRSVSNIVNWPREEIAGWYSRTLDVYGHSSVATYLLRDSLACTLMNRYKLRSRQQVYKKFMTKRIAGFPVDSDERPKRFRTERPPLPWPACHLRTLEKNISARGAKAGTQTLQTKLKRTHFIKLKSDELGTLA